MMEVAKFRNKKTKEVAISHIDWLSQQFREDERFEEIDVNKEKPKEKIEQNNVSNKASKNNK